MKKVYFLGTCSTCRSILEDTGIAELAAKGKFELQDIKNEKMSPEQLDEMKELAGSYESIFSKRAIKYKEWGLKEKILTENDYRNYILQEYTFLKRPVIIVGNAIFIGSDKKTVAAVKNTL
jgi:arsenate reductase